MNLTTDVFAEAALLLFEQMRYYSEKKKTTKTNKTLPVNTIEMK